MFMVVCATTAFSSDTLRQRQCLDQLPPTNADDVGNVVPDTAEQWENYALCAADIRWRDVKSKHHNTTAVADV